MRRLWCAIVVCASSAGADPLPTFELDRLGGDPRWPPFSTDAIQCLFPQASLETTIGPTRFGDDTASAIQWMQEGLPVITFEAVGDNRNVFSIWTESPEVMGPFGWQVGVTPLADVQRELGTCKRGFTSASDRVVCSTPRDSGVYSSFVFKDIDGDITSVPPGELDPSWSMARLTRIERYKGNAPDFDGDCGGLS